MLPTSNTRRRDAILLVSIGVSFLLLIWIINHIAFGLSAEYASSSHGPLLTSLALQKVLQDASPIFGYPSQSTTSLSAATWMKAYPDSTLLVHMNIPGTHDSATWNYTQFTQETLDYPSSLANISPSNFANYRCQDTPIVGMLNAGIRAFDLRYAYDITRTSLVFWHGDALQSETATVEDVLFAFYHWLDEHPSEAVILSFQHEGGGDDVGTQMALFDALTSPAAREYIVQTRGALGTLGEARGKITLFRRFDLNQLPAGYEEAMPGLHFSPSKWTNNGPNIELVYNETTSATAYIQDYYHPSPSSSDSSLSDSIAAKFNATSGQLRRAAHDHPDALFWSFASSTRTDEMPPLTPRMLALGDGEQTGVNQQLRKWLEGSQGMRLGIVLFDFFEEPEGMVQEFLGLM